MLDTAQVIKDYGFYDQCLIKIMPYTVKKMDFKGKCHSCSLQSFCVVSGNIDDEHPFTKYLLLSDYIACDLDQETASKLLQLFGYKWTGGKNADDYVIELFHSLEKCSLLTQENSMNLLGK